ncbi:WD repeat-containing protein 75 [Cylas formicarius]|uniref:WD repeat-containing protein 75 n=1 Tax=Cylas formicarius TaxID=197179 RepID=UPI002958D551|nr:WD repeat-containing protein 75 [Cylas formicarius]
MDLTVNFKGGGSFVHIRPVFSSNAEHLFLASKNAIFEYSTKTGSLLYKYQGIKDDIVGFDRITVDNFDCILACSKTKQLIMWKADTTNKTKIFETQIKTKGNEIQRFHLMSNRLNKDIQVLISYSDSNNGSLGYYVRFKLINITTGERKLLNFKLKISQPYDVDICAGKYFALVQGGTVYFVSLSTLTHKWYNMAEHNRKFMCVTCHPTEEVVLTGDDTGRVVVWQNIFSNQKTQAVFHWHTLAVNCVGFSPQGSYFYSGADECVLVKWDFNNIHNRSFLPRLPAGITQIAPSDNGAFVAVATSDNAVRIVDSAMNEVALIQQLVLGTQFECGIVYDQVTRALVMNGNVGCVQFYSPEDMTLLYNIDIVQQNKITDERGCRMENTDVRKVALSDDRCWMATVEERRDGNDCQEIRLKYWRFDAEKQTYGLNTSIEYPHDTSIMDVAFRPDLRRRDDATTCVTVGGDAKFKAWQVDRVTTTYKDSLVWKCYYVGRYRDLDCKGLCFSIDGSLMAVGFGPILTVWSPDSGDLKCSLVHPIHKAKITRVQFGRGNQCHLVAAAGLAQVAVWNLLTLSMVWVVALKHVSLLLADPLSTHMAVITADNKVYVFEPASPKPVYASRHLLADKDTVIAAAFVPGRFGNDTRLSWYERSNLYFVTSRKELYNVSMNEEAFEYDEEEKEEAINDEEPSFFRKTLPTTRSAGLGLAAPKRHAFLEDPARKNLHEYLESPLQTLPPIRFLCASLLKSLVLRKETPN